MLPAQSKGERRARTATATPALAPPSLQLPGRCDREHSGHSEVGLMNCRTAPPSQIDQLRYSPSRGQIKPPPHIAFPKSDRSTPAMYRPTSQITQTPNRISPTRTSRAVADGVRHAQVGVAVSLLDLRDKNSHANLFSRQQMAKARIHVY